MGVGCSWGGEHHATQHGGCISGSGLEQGYGVYGGKNAADLGR